MEQIRGDTFNWHWQLFQSLHGPDMLLLFSHKTPLPSPSALLVIQCALQTSRLSFRNSAETQVSCTLCNDCKEISSDFRDMMHLNVELLPDLSNLLCWKVISVHWYSKKVTAGLVAGPEGKLLVANNDGLQELQSVLCS